MLAESDEPLSPAEIMRLSGLSRNVVDIHLSRMRRAGEVHRTEDKKYSLGQMPVKVSSNPYGARLSPEIFQKTLP